jgi:sialate O-acetylesterase
VAGYARNDEVLAKLAEDTCPHLRLCRGKGGGWQVADPAAIKSFSALLFSFGQRLQHELDVPVGLILGAVGGTPSGRWMTQTMLDSDRAAQGVLQKAAEDYSPEQMQAAYERALAAWERAAAKAQDAGKRVPRKPSPPVGVGNIRRGEVGDLYKEHISPIVPYGIRGVLWDQGEGGTAIEGLDQFHAMGALIAGWRKAWGQGDFPFLYVQKPSGGGCAWDTEDPITSKADPFGDVPASPFQGGEGLYRELHIAIMNHPYTAMVTARDLGSGIHPVNKSGYGARAARVALGFAYDRSLEIYGPLYQSHQVEGDKIRICFSHVGQGLTARHDESLQGFSIAGEDRQFHWADVEIDGDCVVVSCKEVPTPVAVRYAWGKSSPWANLFNKDGLPALTFRTDDWSQPIIR